jgi:hypothetical protein
MKMKWKKGQARSNKGWNCILCGDTIPTPYWFIRPHHRGGPNLNRQMVNGRPQTFRQKPPCFHLDCFETMGSWFGSTPPVYNNTGKVVLPLQDPKLHLRDGKPL